MTTFFRPKNEQQSYSKPSAPVVSMNLPPIANFNSEFIYNYHVNDERTNESPPIPEYFKKKSMEQSSSEVLDYALRVPRYVKLTWDLPKTPIAQPSSLLENNSQNSIQSNLQKIHTEESFLKSRYSSFSISNQDAINDAGIEINSLGGNNISALVDSNNNSKDGFGSFFNAKGVIANSGNQVSILNNSTNGKPKLVRLPKDSKKLRNDFPNSITEISKRSKNQLVGSKKIGYSPFAVADTFNTNNLKKVGDNAKNASIKQDIQSSTKNIEDMAIDHLANGVMFFDKNNKLKNSSSGFRKTIDVIQKNPLSLQINKLMAVDAFASSSILSFDLRKINDEFQKARSQFSELDDSFGQPFYVGPQILNPDLFQTTVGITGYLIERSIMGERGFEKDKTYTVENPLINNFVDTAVLFGRAYHYSIRTIFKVITTGYDDDVDEIREVGYLIGSKPTETMIKTFEFVPPPPPVDLNFIWDYKDKKLQITWNMPVNSQRDIKQFQVFRRENVEEPFELISQKCFDFSTLKYTTGESIDGNLKNEYSSEFQQLIQYHEEPVTFHIDDDFKINPRALKASKYIYSIVSIDAHGMSSNYSSQFEVSFDFFKNVLTKKLISSAGAPKPYPNLYLNIDAFKDVIKTSGMSSTRLKVYFMPEYFKIMYGDHRIQRMVSTKQDNAYYKIQFINLQNQKSDSLKITIDDPHELTK